MIKRTRRIWFWLLVVAISSLMSGCGSSSSSSNEGASTVVTVTDYSGIRVANATVVLGDSNGAMKAYGVTDADGQVTFDNAPANATITAATTCLRSGSTTTNYAVNVQFDVNGSAVLSLDNCTGPSIVYPVYSGSAAELGTLTVNVTNTPSEVTHDQMTIGRQVFVQLGGLITRQTVTITENDLDNDGTFSIFVIGRDVNQNSIAYGILLNQTFTNGMTVDIPMEPMSFVQYQISNLPTTAVILQPSISIYGTGQGFSSDHHPYSLLSAPSSTTVQVAYIPGFGSEVSYRIDVDLDQDHNGVADSRQSLSVDSYSAPSNQSFDLSKALPAPYVTVTGADTATPTLSWSGVDPAATSIYVAANMRSSATSWYLGFGNLIRSRTSIRYPELPDSLAPFRPNKVDYFSVYTSASEGSVYKTSSGTYQAPNP